MVDVAGKVAHPGLRSLPGGARVADAVRAAGGVLPGVDTDGLNLARVLVDGEQILVGSPSPPSGSAGATGPRPPVSLNHATLEQLDALPGVGPVLAQHILDFRLSHSGFRSLDQLRQISGIGDRKLAELKHLVTLMAAGAADSHPATDLRLLPRPWRPGPSPPCCSTPTRGTPRRC